MNTLQQRVLHCLLALCVFTIALALPMSGPAMAQTLYFTAIPDQDETRLQARFSAPPARPGFRVRHLTAGPGDRDMPVYKWLNVVTVLFISRMRPRTSTPSCR